MKTPVQPPQPDPQLNKLKAANPASLQWRHLQAEFARVDVLIRREVRRWVVAGQDPNDDYRGMYIAQAEAEALLERPFGASWGQWIELPEDEEATFEQRRIQAEEQSAAVAQALSKAGEKPRLQQLADHFGLDRTALDILLLCIAPAFDTAYERLYGYLQDNVTKRRPSVRLVLDLLGQAGIAQFELASDLTPDAALFRHNIIEHIIEPPPANAHWLNQTLHADETVVAWLRGHYEHHGVLAGQVHLEEVVLTETESVLAGDSIECLTTALQAPLPPIVAIYGPDQTSQDAAARLLAQQHGRPLLTVNLKPLVNSMGKSASDDSASDAKELANDPSSAQQTIRLALRDAKLTGSIAYLQGWDSCLDRDKYVSNAVLAQLCDHPDLVILSSTSAWQPKNIERTRPIIWQEFAAPTYRQRQTLWQHYLHKLTDGKASLPQDELENLASQFELTSGTIRDAVAAARDSCNQQSPTTDNRLPITDHLFTAARRYSNPRLSTLARKIDPRYEWDDIVLPADQREILRELIATVRQRNKVLEEWGVGKKLAASAGVTVLFAGPPGTGKTMAAEVIAGELRLDLYKIDLSSVVSKYIGETEKNLEKIFNEASSSNAILFFDEADAIFGKRSEVKDAHDRHANVEVAYLLQRMEDYDGITILATNLRANLDEAFTRRIHFAVDFPFPRVADRMHIWETLFPPDVPKDLEEADFKLLAKRFELAGGSIRNIIVSAAYLAADNGQVVTIEHLLHGAKRELMKMGRLMGDEDF